MRTTIFLLIGCLLFVGCNQPTVKQSEFMTLDQLQKSNKKFLSYEIVQEPEIEGPYRLTNIINSTVNYEGRSPMWRRAVVDGKNIDFKYEDSVGYGFRFLSVENEAGEFGTIMLRTQGKVPNIFERNNIDPDMAGGGATRADPEDVPAASAVKQRLMRGDDGDGKLAREELPERVRPRFDEFDDNADGFLDEAEIDVFANALGAPDEEDESDSEEAGDTESADADAEGQSDAEGDGESDG